MKIISPEQISELEVRRAKFLISVPNDTLIEIYIISTISEIMHLRAERDWSIESDVPERERRLGIQNPNYTQLTVLIRKFLKVLNVSSLQSLIDFCREFKNKYSLKFQIETITPVVCNYSRDIRTADNLDDCFECLSNFAVDQLTLKKLDGLNEWIGG